MIFDNEEFFPVPRNPKDYYISKTGRVLSFKSTPRLLSIWYNEDGYLITKIDNKHCTIHRLLAETFLTRESKDTQVNHKDGNKENNSLDNLEWVTQQENLHHSCTTGLHVNQLCPLIGTNLKTNEKIYFASQSEAKRAGFQQSNISYCLQGRRYSAHGYKWERA